MFSSFDLVSSPSCIFFISSSVRPSLSTMFIFVLLWRLRIVRPSFIQSHPVHRLLFVSVLVLFEAILVIQLANQSLEPVSNYNNRPCHCWTVELRTDVASPKNRKSTLPEPRKTVLLGTTTNDTINYKLSVMFSTILVGFRGKNGKFRTSQLQIQTALYYFFHILFCSFWRSCLVSFRYAGSAWVGELQGSEWRLVPGVTDRGVIHCLWYCTFS